MGKYGRDDRDSRGGRNSTGRDRMPIRNAAAIDPATASAAKPPLEWQILNTFERGDVLIELQKSEGFRGNLLYSVKIGRRPKLAGDRPSVYLRPDDLKDVAALLPDVEAWLKPPTPAPLPSATTLPTTTRGNTE